MVDDDKIVSKMMITTKRTHRTVTHLARRDRQTGRQPDGQRRGGTQRVIDDDCNQKTAPTPPKL